MPQIKGQGETFNVEFFCFFFSVAVSCKIVSGGEVVASGRFEEDV